MRIETLSVFPMMFDTPTSAVGASIIGRARTTGILDLINHDLRDWTHDRHRSTDDEPFGGGHGLLMKVEPVFEALDDLLGNHEDADKNTEVIFFAPFGQRFDQEMARELAGKHRLILVCGRYEGFDERVYSRADRVISLGDFILTGGELPAMCVIDAVCRLLPGALGDEHSPIDESFTEGLLEYPQYTRPAEYRGLKVPDVLLSGNHSLIDQWRREQSIIKTASLRPDLIDSAKLSESERQLVKSQSTEKAERLKTIEIVTADWQVEQAEPVVEAELTDEAAEPVADEAASVVEAAEPIVEKTEPVVEAAAPVVEAAEPPAVVEASTAIDQSLKTDSPIQLTTTSERDDMSEPKHYRELEQQLDTVTSSINELDPIPFPESDLISFDDPTTASASDPESAQKRRAEEAPWKKKKKKRSLARELLSFVATIAFVVCLTAAFKLFVIDIYSVPTGSMSPTISVDDRIIAEKVSRYFSPIQAGDIITFTDPIREGRILVKRVIAVGGQTVDLIDGVVYVNNKALVEPYTLGRPSLPLRTANGVTIEYPYRIPEGQIWVMGDNRTDSLDSRYFGTIDERSVSGRSILVLWPFEHFGTFD